MKKFLFLMAAGLGMATVFTTKLVAETEPRENTITNCADCWQGYRACIINHLDAFKNCLSSILSPVESDGWYASIRGCRDIYYYNRQVCKTDLEACIAALPPPTAPTRICAGTALEFIP